MNAPAPTPSPLSEGMALCLLVWALLLSVAAWSSLSWPLIHDAALLHYSSWLIREGRIPYLELLEMNLPVTWQLHALVQATLGLSDRAVRVADLLVLLGTQRLLVYVLKPAGKDVALGGALLLGTTFLAAGPFASFQRDWMLCLPLLGAWALSTQAGDRARMVGARMVGAGVLVGLAAGIKPQALLVAPLVWLAVVSAWSESDRSAGSSRIRFGLRAGLWMGLGIASVGLVEALVLWHLGALDAFVSLWTGYLSPYYTRLNGDGLELEGGAGLYLRSLQAGIERLWSVGAGLPLLLAVGGLWWGKQVTQDAPLEQQNAHRRLRLALLAGMGYGLLHAVIGIKQWSYHWWPWQVVLAGAMGMLMRPPSMSVGMGERVLGRVLRMTGGAYALALLLTALVVPQGLEDAQARRNKVEALAHTLEHLSQPKDLILGLDTAEGVSHAALLARRKPSSRFIYDFHFFHHMDAPEIVRLRQELLASLSAQPPTLVILWRKSWAHRQSYADLELFPELVQRLDAHYSMVVVSDDYRIYRKWR